MILKVENDSYHLTLNPEYYRLIRPGANLPLSSGHIHPPYSTTSPEVLMAACRGKCAHFLKIRSKDIDWRML